MTRQTIGRSALLMTAAIWLSSCSTLDFKDAEPEKYMGFDCEQLAQLSESYRDTAQNMVGADDISELERRNERNSSIGVRGNARPYEIEQARDQRSIALARRQKGCL